MTENVSDEATINPAGTAKRKVGFAGVRPPEPRDFRNDDYLNPEPPTADKVRGHQRAVIYGPMGTPKLNEALAKAQGGFSDLIKDGSADFVSKRTGGRIKYGYATLPNCIDATKESLAKNGLSVVFVMGNGNVTGTLLHSSGEAISSALPVNTAQPPQALGSAITYMRRYIFCGLLNLAADEDDDGNKAQGNDAKITYKQPPAPAVPKPKLTKINADQVKRLYTIASVAGWSHDDVKAVLKKKFNLDSSKDLTKDLYDGFCKLIEAHPKPKDEAKGENGHPQFEQ